jgi:hypothetical protein
VSAPAGPPSSPPTLAVVEVRADAAPDVAVG